MFIRSKNKSKNMRYVIISSIWFVCALNFATTDFSTLDANDGELTVSSVTSTSITLRWKFPYSFAEDSNVHLSTRYGPRVRVGTPATIQWDNYTGRYFAEYAHSPSEINFKWYLDRVLYESLKDEAYIEVNDLKFPGADYFFDIQRVEQLVEEGKTKVIRAKLVAATRPVLPEEAPKSGAGLFHVYEVYTSSRKVKIYWQGVYGSGRYELALYEDGDPRAVYAVTGPSEYAFSWCLIGLKRTYAILKSINELGVSKHFSMVTIPAQSDILPAIPVHWNYSSSSGQYRISWQKPENLTVSNYTVIWADRVDGKASLRIADFVYLSSNETSFEVSSKQWVELALSVNTPDSSSGLRIARPINCSDKTVDFIIKCPGDETSEEEN